MDQIQLNKLTSKEKLIGCALFLEGEGSFITLWNGIRLSCSSTDKDNIEFLVSILGGHLYGPYLRLAESEGLRKPIYHWQLNTRKHLINVLKALYPFMSLRRKIEIDKMFDYVDQFSIVHGTVKGYIRKCRCDTCKSAYSKYRKEKYIETSY